MARRSAPPHIADREVGRAQDPARYNDDHDEGEQQDGKQVAKDRYHKADPRCLSSRRARAAVPIA
jgi:hypothetical protein